MGLVLGVFRQPAGETRTFLSVGKSAGEMDRSDVRCWGGAGPSPGTPVEFGAQSCAELVSWIAPGRAGRSLYRAAVAAFPACTI